MPHDESNPTLEEALRLASIGLRVFPLTPRTKIPLPGSRGVHDATTDEATILGWWAKTPDANIGLACGNGLIVLDVDPAAFAAYSPEDIASLELAWIGRPRSQTPRGGFHLLMREPDAPIRNSAGKLGAGLDLKTAGGYIVAPPSINEVGAYQWVERIESLDQLPPAPAWLIESAQAPPPSITAPDAERIPQGQRNNALASYAGRMRRAGFDAESISCAIQSINSRQCIPPLPAKDVDKIALSIARYAPSDPVLVDPPGNLSGVFTTLPAAGDLSACPVRVGELVNAHPLLRPPVIHGLLREGETMNIIAPPKTGKSWLTLDLAIAVATGRPWLDRYPTEAGEVLIIDNELHRETSAHRVPVVATARGVAMREIADRIAIDNLRGRLQDILRLGRYFDSLDPGRFKVIVLDAFYRFMPHGGDENDNGMMAMIYNAIDRYAEQLGCCFVCIHHSSKGNQAGKSVTDVGAGAGAQSRAADAHLVLRQHEEEGVVVLDAAVRSWKPVDPACLRWKFPLWSVAPDLDPASLAKPEGRKRDEAKPELWTPERFAAEFVTAEPRLRDEIMLAAQSAGISKANAGSLLRIAETSGLAHRITSKNQLTYFSSDPPPTIPP